jgi:hypothetical protein
MVFLIDRSVLSVTLWFNYAWSTLLRLRRLRKDY